MLLLRKVREKDYEVQTTMYLRNPFTTEPGKLLGRSPSNALIDGRHDQMLLYVCDRSSGRRFQIDKGAEVRMILASARDLRYRNRSQLLTAANRFTFEAYGSRILSRNIGFQRYTWAFTIADVHQLVIGTDFLRAHSILVDLQGRRLIDNKMYASVSLDTYLHPVPHPPTTTNYAHQPSRTPRRYSQIFLQVTPNSLL